MFTGIITHRGTVRSIKKAGENLQFDLAIPKAATKLGDSVAVNGVCLTVARRKGPVHTFQIVPETLQRTSLSDLTKGDRVNVELALKYGQRLDGHFVLGHVDTVGKVTGISQGRTGVRLTIGVLSTKSFVVDKGSVAIDGVSLTVAAVTAKSFTVALVPYTLKNTTLGQRKVGEKVNIEFDIFGKYIHATKRL